MHTNKIFAYDFIEYFRKNQNITFIISKDVKGKNKEDFYVTRCVSTGCCD